jgi:hypothetical protein
LRLPKPAQQGHRTTCLSREAAREPDGVVAVDVGDDENTVGPLNELPEPARGRRAHEIAVVSLELVAVRLCDRLEATLRPVEPADESNVHGDPPAAVKSTPRARRLPLEWPDPAASSSRCCCRASTVAGRLLPHQQPIIVQHGGPVFLDAAGNEAAVRAAGLTLARASLVGPA